MKNRVPKHTAWPLVVLLLVAPLLFCGNPDLHDAFIERALRTEDAYQCRMRAARLQAELDELRNSLDSKLSHFSGDGFK